MRLILNHHSGEPIWRQIVEQVKYLAASGKLKDGDILPSIRVLAGELKINPRTVAKAYEELRNGGLVVMQRGRGAFITEHRDPVPSSVRQRILREQARRLLAEGARLGVDAEEVMRLLAEEAEELDS